MVFCFRVELYEELFTGYKESTVKLPWSYQERKILGQREEVTV